ncbi:MAG: hypothetical protein AAFN10_05425, partial [Bacteroidota bacterium]
MFWTKIILGLIIISFSASCSPKEAPTQPPKDKAQSIIDLSIEAHGGKRFANSSYQFDFRGKTYNWSTENGQYLYTRTFKDSMGLIRDYLSNDGFYRTLNGERSVTTHEQDSM